MSRRENRDELESLRATIQLKDQTIVSLQGQLSDLKVAKEQSYEANRELSEKINVLTNENLELGNQIDRLNLSTARGRGGDFFRRPKHDQLLPQTSAQGGTPSSGYRRGSEPDRA